MSARSPQTHTNPTPTVSRVEPDGVLVELLYDARDVSSALAVHTRDGSSVVPYLDLPSGERLIPYAATNNLIASGCVLLPSSLGAFEDKAGLLAAIRDFLHRYVDLPDLYEEIAAHYVILTWVHDAFNELGYLRFRGDFGAGKTRALLAVGSLCYKPFFASGASTVSPIFHVLDAFGGTLILDEADFRYSDATSDLTKILNNGTVAGLPVLRTMANRHRELNPQAFRVFGPKLVAMRGHYQDPALESRFLTAEMGRRPLRKDIPIHLPSALRGDALELRNRLLAWRFHARWSVGPDPSRLVGQVSPRLNQTALALLSIMDEASLRDRVAAELVGDEARVLKERASSLEATMLGVLIEAFDTATAPFVSVAELTERFNQKAVERAQHPVSNKWVGWVIRERLKLVTTKSRGVYVVPEGERGKCDALAERLGLIAIKPNDAP